MAGGFSRAGSNPWAKVMFYSRKRVFRFRWPFCCLLIPLSPRVPLWIRPFNRVTVAPFQWDCRKMKTPPCPAIVVVVVVVVVSPFVFSFRAFCCVVARENANVRLRARQLWICIVTTKKKKKEKKRNIWIRVKLKLHARDKVSSSSFRREKWSNFFFLLVLRICKE